MEKTCDKYDFGLKDVNVKILGKTTENVIKPNKCNQCDYAFASSQASDLRRHLKMHSAVEKSQTNATNVTLYPIIEALW